MDLPDSLFIEAYKVRDIVKARPLNKEEKQRINRGAPDIRVDPLIGESYTIDRDTLINNFVYTNNKKIKTMGWSSGKQYVVYRQTKEKIRIMQVPLSNTVQINGKMANTGNRKRGDYIVCYEKNDGSIDRNRAYIITSAVFKKMCFIPESDIIVKHKGSHNKLFDIARAISDRINNGGHNDSMEEYDAGTNNFSGIFDNNEVRQSKPMQTGFTGVNNQSTNKNMPTNNRMGNDIPPALNVNNQRPYTIIQQIHDMYGKRVGFVIQARNGETKGVSRDTAIKLALNQKISNAEVVRNGANDMYLRGNNIRLDELPIIYK